MLNIMWIGPAYSRSMSRCPHYTNNNQKKLPSLGDFEASPPQQRIYNVDNNNYNNNTKTAVSATHTKERYISSIQSSR